MTPEQRAQFISNVVDADARREAEKLWQASQIAGLAYAQACVDHGIGVKIADRETKTVEQIEAEFSAFVCEVPELVALRDAADEALTAWNACDAYSEPLEADDGEVIRCALTGFIVHENDRYLLDLRTHEAVLKAALGVPIGYFVGEFTSPADGFDTFDELPIAEAVS